MSHLHFHQDETERKKWQDPDAILREIGLGNGMIFVDVGSGPGFFAMPAAEVVGEGGKVYAIDVDPRSIERLSERASKKGLKNIVLKPATAEETVLFDDRADMVFFGIDLHDFADPAKVLANAMRMLKKGGKVVDLDWKRKSMPFGPPLWKRFSKEKAQKIISDAGFTVKSSDECGRYHYLIIAEKP